MVVHYVKIGRCGWAIDGLSHCGIKDPRMVTDVVTDVDCKRCLKKMCRTPIEKATPKGEK